VRGKQMIACEQIKATSYSQTSFIRTSWFRIWKIGIRPVATGGIRGQSPLKFFVLLKILFCQENSLLKHITKTEVLTPKNVLCPPSPWT